MKEMSKIMPIIMAEEDLIVCVLRWSKEIE